MTIARQRLGARAEELVARRLREAGWEILARNSRTRYGEIDIVALHGWTLVFVEVKAGRAGATAGPERPAFAVDPEKRRRLRRLAAGYLAERPALPSFQGIRFDVVGVTVDDSGAVVDYERIEDAF